MASWEWSQWALVVLIAGNIALAAYQFGGTRSVTRDVTHTGAALVITATFLAIIGQW